MVFRSNSHTQPNYRVPVLKETHEDQMCPSEACRKRLEMITETKPISKLAQRAQREATGYYCGYTFKGQPVGKRFVKAADPTAGMEDNTPGQRRGAASHTARSRTSSVGALRSPLRNKWAVCPSSCTRGA